MSIEDGARASSGAHEELARRDGRLLEMRRAQRRLQHLYDISRLLACFDSVERTVPEIMAIFDQALTLDSAVLILDAPGSPRMMVWRAEADGEQLLRAAKMHAQATYRSLMRSGIDLESATTRTLHFPRRREDASRAGEQSERTKNFVLLPLALERGAVLGALQIEGAHRLEEQDLAFMSAIVNELAVAVDRCRTKTAGSSSADDARALRARRTGEVLREPPGDRNGGPQESRARLDGIHRSAESMNRLFSDLVDTATIEANRFSIERGVVAVAPLVAAAIEAVQPLAANKSLSLVSEVEAELRPLYVDAARLRQVLASLLGNATKFAPPRGTVTVRAASAGGETIFSVSDDGSGIPEGELPHLFDPFWQAEQHARLGSGLGLFIAKGIVEAHRGRIWVESAIGEGSTFFVALPGAGPSSRHSARAPRADRGAYRPDPVKSTIERRASLLIEFVQGLDLRNEALQTVLESRRVARELARRAVVFRRELMAVVSDALRSPLAPAAPARPNERRDRVLPARGQQQTIRQMFAAMARLTKLIEHALVRGGRVTEDIEPCSAGAIAVGVLDELRASANAKGLGLGLRHVGVLAPLRRDPALVRLILLNLVENAISSTDRGLVEVVVQCDSAAHRLSVIDSGPGVPAAERAHIFEPFARTTSAERRRSGLRLGLPLVREMASAIGGQVEVESEEGSGNAFTVTLPRMAQELIAQGAAVH